MTQLCVCVHVYNNNLYHEDTTIITCVLNNREAKYWAGQKFCVNFSIQFYGKNSNELFGQPNTSNKSDRNEGRYRKQLYFKPTIFHFQ